jgi:hypothetical protein
MAYGQDERDKTPKQSSFKCGIEGEFLKKIKTNQEKSGKKFPSTDDLAALSRNGNNLTKYITLHIHYVLRQNKTGNFNKIDDGWVGTPYHQPGVNGYTRAQTIVNNANIKMANNYPHFLPNPNNTPVLPKRVQFILGSVNFIEDDYYFGLHHYTGDFPMDPMFGIQRGCSINVYFAEHDTIKYKNHPTKGASGIANDIPDNVNPGYLATNIQDWGSTYKNHPTWDGTSHVLCHEVGHLLGLHHDWPFQDYCSDTPPHPNCWAFNANLPPCDSWLNISNNTMSYNGGWQETLTPCQIQRVHDRLNTFLSSYATTTPWVPICPMPGPGGGGGTSAKSEINNSLKITPNPFVNNFEMEVFSDKKEKISIFILDMYGNKIKSIKEKSEKNSGYYNCSIDLSDAKSGLYNAIVQFENGTIISKIISKVY